MDLTNSVNYIENDRLYDYAAASARLLKAESSGSCRSMLRSLRQSMEEIRRCHSLTAKRCENLLSPPGGCSWLLDNYYMALREYSVCRSAFERAGRLRLSSEGPLVTALCRSLLHSGHGEINEERSRLYLDGFQSVTVLRRFELELFPAAVRAVCIEALAALCKKLSSSPDGEGLEKEFSALFTTLRLFSVLDCEKLINACDVQSAILAADPSGDYPLMDAGSKREYLRRLQRMADKQGIEEHVLASRLIKEAKLKGQHVGISMFPEKKRGPSLLYIGSFFFLSLVSSLYISFAFDSTSAALLLLLPMSELIKSIMDFILLRLVHPSCLCRMDISKLSPDRGKTVLVISALLSSEDEAKRLAARLEKLYHACKREKNFLSFALLADLREAELPRCVSDSALIKAAEKEISRLNAEYGGSFCLFTRERSFDGEKYTAWERKRGALIELASFLRGDSSSLILWGDKSSLEDCRFILTLDSDTEIYPGSAAELIGAMLHPLNRPLIDEKSGLVVKGHGIIQPRISTQLKSASETDFALIFAGGGGCDPYGGLCGELYMDAFKSGGFAGKGIIDIDSLLFCTAGRFPEGCILSHDALEGAYLKGAYMGDTEFSDSFPSLPLAYYKRQHRWVRGDWQNAPWIFKTELPPIERFRLFDSLRRSLIAPATLLAIVFGFYFPHSAAAVAAWAALTALLSRLFIAMAEESVRHREKVRLKRYTRLLTGMGGAIVQCFMRLWLLPYEAWICVSAACTALWRMLLSRKKLLEWETAAHTGGGKGFADHIRAMLPALALGFLLLISAPDIIGRATGLMWLLSPAAAAALALPRIKEQELSRSDREYILSAAEESWRYFRDFSGAEDNFLPPDNFQQQPPVGLAHRTSPTNIGLAMASAVAAYDMGIIGGKEEVEYIFRILNSLERMPKAMGHLYNWYDTRTLRPLSPPFISTVDSGNFYAALVSVRKAMREQGENAIADRISVLMAGMNFSPLFDFERKLFYICYDTEKQRGAGGWYDLMASEAMLTSYIAVSKGNVPVEHWRRLSRAQLQKDGYRGLASWTGTMFEYLMPELFMPFYQGSLLWENARFCLYAQKRNRFAGKPWGISESAFYSLDSAMNYRYKAHGCSALALKRGQEADMVISPYSSFLAMSVDPAASVKNLRRLQQLGARGRYGFIEALDFTPERCRSEQGEKVLCYMAHHIGMSMLSAANAVCSGSIQRRFMADAACAAYSLLLQEQLPTDGVVIRREMSRSSERAERNPLGRWQLEGNRNSGEHACLLSNGAYNIMSTNFSWSRASLASLCIYEGSMRHEIISSGQRRELFSSRGCESWKMSEESLSFDHKVAGISVSSQLFAAAGEWGECRSLSLQSREEGEADICLSFIPILANLNDYVNHPAFWRLGMEAEREGNFLLIRRLRRGDKREVWLCIGSDMRMQAAADRNSSLGSLSDPYVKISVHVKLAAGEKQKLNFALCMGMSRKEALESAERVLKGCDRACLTGAAAAHLGMNAAETGAAMTMLHRLQFKKLKDAAAKKALWQYGISGDLPIICCSAQAMEAMQVLRRFCLLKSCGFESELVYLSEEQGEYHQPFRHEIHRILASLSLESLAGSRGGIHFAPPEAADIIKSRSAVVIGSPELKSKALHIPRLSSGRNSAVSVPYSWQNNDFEYYVNHSLPSRAWQQIMTNGRFGCIAADFGPAFMWQYNARELPITKPPANIRSTRGAEAVWLDIDGRKTSLFAANDGYPCRVSFAPGLAQWEKDIGGKLIKSSMFVPRGIDARIIIIRGASGLRLSWALKPCLSSEGSAALSSRVDGKVFICENPDSYLPVKFLAGCNFSTNCRDDFTPAAMLMDIEVGDITVLVCGCCSEEELKELCKPSTAIAAFESCKKYWSRLTGRLNIASGHNALDRYMNGWAVYQAVACRLEGRTSLYQLGGAYGFRDQLQDSINLLLISPDYARERILDCCRHQYEQGDVMHWWHAHPEGDRGLRSRCSDDLLWLSLALCEYCAKTGDYSICDVEIPFISSPPLADEERDRYESPSPGSSADVLEHARRSLDCCISRGFGPHGLPFFGSGDWNDAIDAVEGESVWLGWFFSLCAHEFSKLLKKLGQEGHKRYSELSEKAGKAADSAWSGSHYYRGYLSDGSVLGGEERLDSLVQSWAAFNPWSSPEKVDKALHMCLERLVDKKHSLVKIFDPPFSPEEPYVGYISSYGKGFRENGGQYTHAAVWLAIACLRRGMREEGFELLEMLLPSRRDPAAYEAEPYVISADVYSAPGHEGEAGWSWYTGSAGWYFRAVAEELLGLRLEGGESRISPCLPSALQKCKIKWTNYSGKELFIEIDGDKTELRRAKERE